MRKIEAIIRHIKLDELKRALDEIEVSGITVTDVRGAGKQKGYTETWRGTKTTVFLRPKVKIEMVVEQDMVNTVVDTIVKATRTGEIGDGKIFIIPVEETVRIRTGEKGLTAV